ncbi:hypothetical protein ACLOJK_024236 [Asimina triloba]
MISKLESSSPQSLKLTIFKASSISKELQLLGSYGHHPPSANFDDKGTAISVMARGATWAGFNPNPARRTRLKAVLGHGWVTAPSQHLSIAIRRQQRRRTSQAAGTSRSPAAEETHLAGTSRSPAAEETHLAGTSRSPAAEETHLSIAGSRDAPPDRLPRLRRRQQRRTSRLRIVFLASVAGSRARDAPPGSRSSSSPPSQASVFCSLAEI